MTTPTHNDLLQQLRDTREQDQETRLSLLLLRWALLIGAALATPTLVVLVVMSR